MSDPNEQKVIEIYKKERQYQRECFGEYKKIPTLNLASFILFIEEYLKKSKEGYNGQWSKDLPQWLESCKEAAHGHAPILTYEYLIKVFTLAGAALEAYCELNPEYWRVLESDNTWKKIVEGEL